jgi:very-short-patch-repair endonuclease
MGDKTARPDLRIAQAAARQHGAVTLRQLEATGLSRAAVAKRAATGRLHRVHRGVYAVGHPELSLEGRWMAAVLALGDGAMLSHGSAAGLWGLLRPIDGPIDVSLPGDGGRERRRGIHIHRCPSLKVGAAMAGLSTDGLQSRHPVLVTMRKGIPLTTVPRTIADLRGVVPPRLVRRAIRQAELAGFRLDRIRSDRTRSDLERDFLRLCRRHGLPEPEVNVKIGRWTVDFIWPAERLAVETDSWGYHRGSVAFEDDHARDLDLRRRGYEVRRFTERQIGEEPSVVAADLAEALFGSAGHARRTG